MTKLFVFGSVHAYYKYLSESTGLIGAMPDIEIIVFDDSTDHSTAKRYKVDALKYEFKAVKLDDPKTYKKVELTKKDPTHAGEAVVELLVKYINGES